MPHDHEFSVKSKFYPIQLFGLILENIAPLLKSQQTPATAGIIIIATIAIFFAPLPVNNNSSLVGATPLYSPLNHNDNNLHSVDQGGYQYDPSSPMGKSCNTQCLAKFARGLQKRLNRFHRYSEADHRATTTKSGRRLGIGRHAGGLPLHHLRYSRDNNHFAENWDFLEGKSRVIRGITPSLTTPNVDFSWKALFSPGATVRQERRRFKHICREYKELRSCVFDRCPRSIYDQLLTKGWAIVDFVCVQRWNEIKKNIVCLKREQQAISLKCETHENAAMTSLQAYLRQYHVTLASGEEMQEKPADSLNLAEFCRHTRKAVNCIVPMTQAACNSEAANLIADLFEASFKNLQALFGRLGIDRRLPVDCEYFETGALDVVHSGEIGSIPQNEMWESPYYKSQKNSFPTSDPSSTTSGETNSFFVPLRTMLLTATLEDPQEYGGAANRSTFPAETSGVDRELTTEATTITTSVTTADIETGSSTIGSIIFINPEPQSAVMNTPVSVVIGEEGPSPLLPETGIITTTMSASVPLLLPNEYDVDEHLLGDNIDYRSAEALTLSQYWNNIILGLGGSQTFEEKADMGPSYLHLGPDSSSKTYSNLLGETKEDLNPLGGHGYVSKSKSFEEDYEIDSSSYDHKNPTYNHHSNKDSNQRSSNFEKHDQAYQSGKSNHPPIDPLQSAGHVEKVIIRVPQIKPKEIKSKLNEPINGNIRSSVKGQSDTRYMEPDSIRNNGIRGQRAHRDPFGNPTTTMTYIQPLLQLQLIAIALLAIVHNNHHVWLIV